MHKKKQIWDIKFIREGLYTNENKQWGHMSDIYIYIYLTLVDLKWSYKVIVSDNESDPDVMFEQ
jgi:hypothetical protein